MSSIRFLSGLLCAAFTLPSMAATLDEWGNFTAIGTFTCAATPCNIIDFTGDPDDLDPAGLSVEPGHFDGGPMAAGAYSEISAGADPDGAGRAQATLVGGLAAPELKAEAYSNAGGGVTSLAVGVQGYTYLGGSGTVSVSLDLTGAINDTTAPPTLSAADEAKLALLDLDPAEVPDLTRLEVIGALYAPHPDLSLGLLSDFYPVIDPIAALALFDSFATIDEVTLVEDAHNPAVSNLGNVISVSGLNPGDSFYLFTALLASADGAGQYADAFSTLSAEFVVGGDEIAAASVPLPAPVWLLGSAFGLLLARRSRSPVVC